MEPYTDKVFEFSNFFMDNSEWAGKIKIVQIGETCLDKGAAIMEHIQICHEITFVISGQGTLGADREESPCRVGDIQVVSKGTKHWITANADSRLRYIHFAFELEDYEPRELAMFYGQCKNILLHDDGGIRLILSMLVDEYANRAQFTNLMRECLVQAALVLFWRKVHTPGQQSRPLLSKNPMGSTVYHVLQYIDHNLEEKLTVGKVASHFSYSSDYLSHLFKEKTGVSLKKYIIAARMNYAQKLLLQKKFSLEEITQLIGYESIQAFCKAFKKYTGHTPGEVIHTE